MVHVSSLELTTVQVDRYTCTVHTPPLVVQSNLCFLPGVLIVTL